MMLLGFFGLEFAFRQSKQEASNVLKNRARERRIRASSKKSRRFRCHHQLLVTSSARAHLCGRIGQHRSR